MNNQTAILTLLDSYIEKTANPLLKSFKSLPTYALEQLVDEFVKQGKITINDHEIVLCFDINDLTKRIENAMIREVLVDNVGWLIRFGASKNVIREITGVNPAKVITKRKWMNNALPRIGRPRVLEDDDKDMIEQMWSRPNGSITSRLISIHLHTTIPIDDVWSVVSQLDYTHQQTARHVSKLD